MAELWHHYWLSIIAAVAFALTFVPDKWTAKVRTFIAGIDFPGGDKTPKEAATEWLTTLNAERLAIEADQKKLDDRKRALADAESLVVKGVA